MIMSWDCTQAKENQHRLCLSLNCISFVWAEIQEASIAQAISIEKAYLLYFCMCACTIILKRYFSGTWHFLLPVNVFVFFHSFGKIFVLNTE